jgi:DNA replication initiation complex subunit (GINS family)
MNYSFFWGKMADDVSLTYEKLFDLTRKEKSNEELQKLDPSFFNDLIGYLNDKREILAKEKQNTVFSKSEKEMTRKQLQNIKKLITELYMRREQKLVNLAIMKSRTNSHLIDTSSLLEEEKILFTNMVKLLNDYKTNVLFNVLAGKAPSQPNSVAISNEEVKIEFVNDVPKFMGKELETYGPFAKDQVVSLPKDVASILVNKGRAKKIE